MDEKGVLRESDNLKLVNDSNSNGFNCINNLRNLE